MGIQEVEDRQASGGSERTGMPVRDHECHSRTVGPCSGTVRWGKQDVGCRHAIRPCQRESVSRKEGLPRGVAGILTADPGRASGPARVAGL